MSRLVSRWCRVGVAFASEIHLHVVFLQHLLDGLEIFRKRYIEVETGEVVGLGKGIFTLEDLDDGGGLVIVDGWDCLLEMLH